MAKLHAIKDWKTFLVKFNKKGIPFPIKIQEKVTLFPYFYRKSYTFLSKFNKKGFFMGKATFL